MERLVVYVISLTMAFGGLAARAAGDTKSEQLLAQARAALGGDGNLSKVQGAKADEGKADVIDAKGPGSFEARLFLDKKSHRPLMLAYRGLAPRMIMQTRRGDGPPPAAAAPDQMPPPQIVDIQLFLDDYRVVDGVLLPHHLSRSIDGKPAEEMTFKTIKINPVFKPDAFSAR